MAKARTGKVEPGGFDLSIADRPIDKKFLCKICHLILRKPMQGFCGHRFCEGCLTKLLENKTDADSKYCPACLKDVERDDLSEENLLDKQKIYSDNAIKRDATNVGVHCLNVDCPWRGNLRQYDEHESTCKFKSFECICGFRILLSKEAEHLTSECVLRKVPCQYCGTLVTFKFLKSHLDECPMVKFNCEYCGKKDILRKYEEQHYATECKVKMSKCKICSQMVAEGRVRQHIETDVGMHLEKLGEKLQAALVEFRDGLETLSHPIQESKLRLEQITGQLQRIEEVNPALAEGSGPDAEAVKLDLAIGGGDISGTGASADRGSLAEIKGQIQSLGQRVSVFDSIGSVLNQEIMCILIRMEQFEARGGGGGGGGGGGASSSELDEVKAKLRQLEQANSTKDAKLAELSLQLKNQEMTNYDGTLLWKITEVTRRRSEARSGSVGSIYSPPFYTSRTGYKMCARLYFNGDGMGRGTHISLYFVVMRGEYDNLLRWPFKQKVTLMLQDFNRREHVSDAFRPDPASTSFRQPQTNMNIASGCPLFCQLSRLDSPGNSCYVKEDTMFIRIIVDISDL